MKVLKMLGGLSDEAKADARYPQACDLLAHLLAARSNWLARLTGSQDPYPTGFPKGNTVDELDQWAHRVESGWRDYLGCLDDRGLDRQFQWTARNGGRYEWTVEGVLTQLNGHHWYHRGQIVLLIDQLGGETEDTDFLFWSGHELEGGAPVRAVVAATT